MVSAAGLLAQAGNKAPHKKGQHQRKDSDTDSVSRQLLACMLVHML